MEINSQTAELGLAAAFKRYPNGGEPAVPTNSWHPPLKLFSHKLPKKLGLTGFANLNGLQTQKDHFAIINCDQPKLEDLPY